MKINDIYHATFTEAGSVFSVHRTSVARWCKNQGAPINPDGKTVNIPAIIDWRLDQKEVTQDAACESEESKQALTNFRQERARVMQITRERLEGKLIPISKVAEAWGWRARIVKTGLINFANRLAPVLIGKSRDEARQILKDECNQLLADYLMAGAHTPQADEIKGILADIQQRFPNRIYLKNKEVKKNGNKS